MRVVLTLGGTDGCRRAETRLPSGRLCLMPRSEKREMLSDEFDLQSLLRHKRYENALRAVTQGTTAVETMAAEEELAETRVGWKYMLTVKRID